MDSADIEPEVRAVVHKHLQTIAPAVHKPREEWLQENYLVAELNEIQGERGTALTADDLLSAYGEHIAQLVRGEQTRLARTTTEHILQANLSYYPSDLLVVGSPAALVYDRPDEAGWSIQVLGYAKMQLLEFRYYDSFMTRVLSDVYNTREPKKKYLALTMDAPARCQPPERNPSGRHGVDGED